MSHIGNYHFCLNLNCKMPIHFISISTCLTTVKNIEPKKRNYQI